jgi:hypothetical protein
VFSKGVKTLAKTADIIGATRKLRCTCTFGTLSLSIIKFRKLMFSKMFLSLWERLGEGKIFNSVWDMVNLSQTLS